MSKKEADKKQKNKKQKNKAKTATKKGMNKEDWVYVKDSRIHGKGLFAKKKIKAGQVLGEVEGKYTKKDGPHVLWLDDLTQGFKVNCVFKYINHAPKANAAYYEDLTVVAIKDIKKDEEITHDYGEAWH